MTMTERLRRRDVAAAIDAGTRWVPTRVNGPPLVPPAGGDAELVGTAFEFALAAGLNARRLAWGWVSGPGEALDRLQIVPSWRAPAGLHSEVAARVRHGHELLESIPPDRELDVRAARACLGSARLSAYARAEQWFLADLPARLPPLLDEARPEEVAELQALYAVVPWEKLAPAEPVVISPTFPSGSATLGGAVADLLAGDAIIDVKVVAEPVVRRRHFRQLVAYALLARRFGVNPDPHCPVEVNRVAVYHARWGRVVDFDLADILASDSADAILDAILGTARAA